MATAARLSETVPLWRTDAAILVVHHALSMYQVSHHVDYQEPYNEVNIEAAAVAPSSPQP